MGKLVANPLAKIANPKFTDDLLGRKDFGEQLTRLVRNASSGSVLALDAPWGEGKTTFVKMWCNMLRERGAEVIYLDAFDHDHFDDPFLPLVATLLDAVKEREPQEDKSFKDVVTQVKKNAAAVGAKFAGLVADIGLRAATGSVLTSEDVKAAEKIAKDAAWGRWASLETAIADRIERFANDSKAVEAFRSNLEALAARIASATGYPLVFIIDELDRCRPPFAVKLIERIKHVLDVPGIAFVFVVNRKQLEEAVRCIYGAKIDAGGYLAKFVHVWCALPKQSRRHDSDYHKYCRALYEAHELEVWDDQDMLRRLLPEIARLFGLSLREMERVYTSLAVFYTTAFERTMRLPVVALVLAVLHVRYPEIYRELRERRIDYTGLKKQVSELKQPVAKDDLMAFVHKWLQYCLLPDDQFEALPSDSEIRSYGQAFVRYGLRSRHDIVPHLCALFDMFYIE